MTPYALVFYADLLAMEFENSHSYDVTIRAMCAGNYEFYSGAFVYFPHRSQRSLTKWLRMDGTPILDQNVPNALKVWVLILT